MASDPNHFTDENGIRDAETYRRVYERAVDAIIIHDRETQQILDVNPAVLRRYGFTMEQMLTMTPVDLHAPEERDLARERIEVANPEDPHVYNHLTGDGRRITVEILSDQIDFDGRPAWLSIVRDITERQRAETILSKARDEAIDASAKKSEFVASISHELRTPINGILGMAALLRETTLDETQREYATTIHDATESLLGLLNELLDLSKMEAGKLELGSDAIDAKALAEDVTRLLGARASQTGVELRLETDSKASTLLLGDGPRLRQVLVNLAGNALKFTPEGHVTLRVRCTGGSRDRATLRFDVEDTGIGIETTQLEHVFEPFGQARGAALAAEGTGLGLSISRSLVELMGGTLQVESEPGRGTTFWFELELPRHVEEATPSIEGVVANPGNTALVVAAPGARRDAFVAEIKQWGAEVETLDSAGEALTRAEHIDSEGAPWNVALIDMQLSDLDGETLGRTLRKRSSLRELPLLLTPPPGLTVDASRLARSSFLAAVHDVEELRFHRSLVMPSNEGLEATPESTPEPAPKAEPETATEPINSSEDDATPSANENAVPAILVVEDNPVNQKVVCYMLRRMGFEVDLAEDGEEGVSRFRVGSYDLVLMDCQMPVMDGYEATRHIRRIPGERARTPIIALTANAMDGDREKCLAAGMDDYMSKPAKADQLSDMMKRWIPDCEARCEAGAAVAS